MHKPLGRGELPKQLIAMGRHLVYAEGTKTEPLYVESVKAELAAANHVDPDQIEIHCFRTSKTKHTTELLKRAERDVAKRMEKGETVHAVWIFFDKDSFDDFGEAYRSIIGKRVKGHENPHGFPADENDVAWIPCYSNECFEVWPYLHFEDLTAELPRKDYIPKINSFIHARKKKASYTKSIKNLHQFLRDCGGDVKKAIAFAKRKTKKLADMDPRPNPSTGIYIFAEFFTAYIDGKS